MVEKHHLELDDKLALTYYLVLQDRYAEAYAQFKLIKPEGIKDGKLKMQYDYMWCYFDILNGYPKFEIARKLIMNYLNYPVLNWRMMFQEIKDQLDEFDGK